MSTQTICDRCKKPPDKGADCEEVMLSIGGEQFKRLDDVCPTCVTKIKQYAERDFTMKRDPKKKKPEAAPTPTPDKEPPKK